MVAGTDGQLMMMQRYLKLGQPTRVNTRKEETNQTLESGRRTSDVLWMHCPISKRFERGAAHVEKTRLRFTEWEQFVEEVSHHLRRRNLMN